MVHIFDGNSEYVAHVLYKKATKKSCLTAIDRNNCLKLIKLPITLKRGAGELLCVQKVLPNFILCVTIKWGKTSWTDSKNIH